MFLHDTSRSYVGVEMDGSVIIRCGIQDIGGGQASSLCQIVAETLGVSLEDVKIYFGDTALTPLAGTTTATRQLYMSGNATLTAAREVRKVLLKKAGEMLDVDPEKLALADGEVVDTAGLGINLMLEKVAKACASDGIPLYHLALFKAPFRGEFEGIQGDIFPDFTFGSHAAEVAVDLETGKIRLVKLASCFDVGKAINPSSVEGQMEGGAVYAVGYALTEEVALKNGITMTPSLTEYLLPTSMDVPEVETVLLESGEGLGPFGAKGIGEPSTLSVAPSIINAIHDAVGVRIYELPATPEKVITAMRGSRAPIENRDQEGR